MESKLGFIIQARVSSTRLPNKIRLPFYRDDSILDCIIKRIKSRYKSYPIIIATGKGEKNLELKEYSDKYNIYFYQGSENDVLDRFIKASQKFKINSVIRVCSDNPFINLDYIDQLINFWGNNINDLSYLSFCNSKKTPVIKTHLGVFAEIVSLKCLLKVKANTTEQLYLEHVTNYIYENSNMFNVKFLNAPKLLFDRNDLRFTIDDSKDFECMKELYEIYKNGNESIKNIVDFVDNVDVKYKKRMIANIKIHTK